MAHASVALHDADWRTSAATAEQAVTVFEDLRLPWRQVAALHVWGRAVAGDGRTDEATARHSDAAAVLARIGAPKRWGTDLPTGARELRRTSTPSQRASTTLGP